MLSDVSDGGSTVEHCVSWEYSRIMNWRLRYTKECRGNISFRIMSVNTHLGGLETTTRRGSRRESSVGPKKDSAYMVSACNFLLKDSSLAIYPSYLFDERWRQCIAAYCFEIITDRNLFQDTECFLLASYMPKKIHLLFSFAFWYEFLEDLFFMLICDLSSLCQTDSTWMQQRWCEWINKML